MFTFSLQSLIAFLDCRVTVSCDSHVCHNGHWIPVGSTAKGNIYNSVKVIEEDMKVSLIPTSSALGFLLM